MGRRKKEPPEAHRAAIAAAAERLFSARGVEGATMDDIAREAGYSKATLYVYYQSKEALVAALALESMRGLHRCLHGALAAGGDARTRYDGLCRALADYQARFPAYFHFVLGELRSDVEAEDALPVERETYAVGEEINGELAAFLRAGMEAGDLRRDLDVPSTVFTFWGALSGLILLADRKRTYLELSLGLSAQAFLDHGTALLYRAIAAEGGAQ